jgi:glycosyl transferase, family 25
MLPAFCINLDRHTERRSFIEAQLVKAGIEAERFPGIDGAELPEWLRGYFPADCPLRPAQIGCIASHLAVMRKIVFEHPCGAALVLEDDAILPSDLRAVLDALLATLPPRWDIVRLCRPPKRAFRPLRELSTSRPHTLVRYSRIPVGAAGYLVSSTGALKLLRPRHIRRPNDVEIAHPWLMDLDVYGVVPPPISQERVAVPSTVRGKRGDITRMQRAMPEPRRMMFNMRKLGVGWWLRCLADNALRSVRPIPGSRQTVPEKVPSQLVG